MTWKAEQMRDQMMRIGRGGERGEMNIKTCRHCDISFHRDDASPIPHDRCGRCHEEIGALTGPVPTPSPNADRPTSSTTGAINALETQVGGSHYRNGGIQPVEYIESNHLGFCEGNVVKYVTRHQHKGGRQDLEKAKHYIDLLIELRYGDEAHKRDGQDAAPVGGVGRY